MIDYLEAVAASSCASPNGADAVLRLLFAQSGARRKPPRCRRENRPTGFFPWNGGFPCRFTLSVRMHRPEPAVTTAGARQLVVRHRRQAANPGDEWPWPPVSYPGLRDRKAYRELVIMLATEIYHRERGSFPSSDEALVGTYLKSLPDDGSAELDDGTTPTVQ